MAREIDAGHITFGVVGKPGQRTFYVQAADDVDQVTLKIEKGQLQALCSELAALLERLEEEFGVDPVVPSPSLTLREPIESEYPVGDIGVGFDPDGDRLALHFGPFRAEDEPDHDDDVVFWTSRSVVRHLVKLGETLIEGGRPPCEFCGLPKDEDHVCPKTNGHVR